jgi:hypothetical protein
MWGGALRAGGGRFETAFFRVVVALLAARLCCAMAFRLRFFKLEQGWKCTAFNVFRRRLFRKRRPEKNGRGLRCSATPDI